MQKVVGSSPIIRSVECADEQDATLLLGSRGPSGVRSAVLGSVSYGVVHHSRRPVVIVPPPS